jgi:peptide-methionine (S)-S-oxide reductase
VCTGSTGHAEAIQVTFDPRVVTYRELLGVFFAYHDPTTLNRQGPDAGPQYRSAIFPADAGQDRLAREVIESLTREQCSGRRS